MIDRVKFALTIIDVSLAIVLLIAQIFVGWEDKNAKRAQAIISIANIVLIWNAFMINS